MTDVWVVDGLIGAGKSTLLDALRSAVPFDNATFVDEPVDLWQTSGLLGAMYTNELTPSVFQLMALATRGIRIQQALRCADGPLIMERSPWSDREIFANVNMDADSWERKAYDAIFNELQISLEDVRLNVIYLQLPVEKLLERITLRQRESESRIDVSYLERLQRAYDDYLRTASCSVHVVDASLCAEDVCARVVDIMRNKDRQDIDSNCQEN